MVGLAYVALQIPFAMYHVCTEKMLIRNGCLPHFDFYGDKIICFLLASGVGAGFASTYEIKKIFDALIADVTELRNIDSFLNRGYLASGILLGGFICMAILSILSSISRNHSTSKGFLFR